MDIEKLVPKLETCKLLKDKGFPPNTVYTWCKVDDKQIPLSVNEMYLTLVNNILYDPPVKITGLCIAPTAEELLRELPKKIHHSVIGKVQLTFKVQHYYGGNVRYGVHYKEGLELYGTTVFSNEKLAEALAQCWLWCKDQGYI